MTVGDGPRPIRKRTTVRLTDIAQAAGVDISTASRALNPASVRRVNPETAERIRALARAMGYEPNPWARSLRTRSTMLMGLILPRITYEVLALMFEAAEDEALEHGYQTLTTSTHDHPDEQWRVLRLLLKHRVDGLIMATSRLNDPTLRELEDRRLPFILLNRSSGEHATVRADDERGGYLATSHLIDIGHRRIGLVAGAPDISTTALRQQGFMRAHARAGIEVDERLIVTAGFGADAGLRAGDALLEMTPRPTAIFAMDDSIALGVMAAAHRRGIVIPSDLAVIGYNDVPTSSILPIPLSSVSVPLRAMGQLAVRSLLRRIQDGHVESTILQPQLQVRASTARGAFRGS
jgi:LacI family transcriptional regulator